MSVEVQLPQFLDAPYKVVKDIFGNDVGSILKQVPQPRSLHSNT